MTTTFTYLISILILSFVMKGSSYCNLNNINIGTTRSGRTILGKPEWNVVVKNNCNCTQSQIRLSCRGFQTTEIVSRSILAVEGDSCLLINGNPLKGFATVSFSYAWDPPFILTPLTSHTTCS
ncbi:protein TAPETUM DETERMINANT 1-like [Vigna umbellata]|uniref:protein TAPETUM DETERMINANT 1-like n=1 Tax=Vigna umbellata TaxID=87088 RepID=UPI001F5FA8C5|nr:protein TAPETUM DETERMINANT 1-like [Vigna umbellata]